MLKKHWCTNNIKVENSKIKKVRINNFTSCYFDDIIKFEDFDLDILMDEKSHGNIWIYDISYKALVQNLGIIDSVKYMIC